MFSLSQLFKTKNTYVFCHSQTATWPMALGGKQKVPSSVSIHSTPGNSAKTTPFNSSGKPRCAECMEKFTQRKGKTWPHEQGKIGWVNILLIWIRSALDQVEWTNMAVLGASATAGFKEIIGFPLGGNNPPRRGPRMLACSNHNQSTKNSRQHGSCWRKKSWAQVATGTHLFCN